MDNDPQAIRRWVWAAGLSILAFFAGLVLVFSGYLFHSNLLAGVCGGLLLLLTPAAAVVCALVALWRARGQAEMALKLVALLLLILGSALVVAEGFGFFFGRERGRFRVCGGISH